MGLRLFLLPNFPEAMFIQGGTFIPDSRVGTFFINFERKQRGGVCTTLDRRLVFFHNVLLYYWYQISKNWRPILPCSYFWTLAQYELLNSPEYTNSLINADSFYANFTNKTIQKIPIPHLTRPMRQKFLH